MAALKTFTLEIVHPDKSEKIQVRWFSAQGPTGNFVVGPDHASLISLLKRKGDLTYQRLDGKKVIIAIFGGVLKVENNHALVLLES